MKRRGPENSLLNVIKPYVCMCIIELLKDLFILSTLLLYKFSGCLSCWSLMEDLIQRVDVLSVCRCQQEAMPAEYAACGE